MAHCRFEIDVHTHNYHVLLDLLVLDLGGAASRVSLQESIPLAY